MHYRKLAPDDKFFVKSSIVPKLVFDRETYDRVMFFVENCSTKECQWFSTIERIPTQTDLHYYIKDMFIPHQTVGSTTVESTPQQMQQMWQEIKTLRNLQMSEIGALMGQANFWGHSHVNMEPKPSATDDKHWDDMIADANARLVKRNIDNPIGMIIFNRSNRNQNRIYDPKLGLIWQNVDLLIQDNTDYDYIVDALTSKIASTPVVTNTLSSSTPSSSMSSPPKDSGSSTNTPVVLNKDQKENCVFLWNSKKK